MSSLGLYEEDLNTRNQPVRRSSTEEVTSTVAREVKEVKEEEANFDLDLSEDLFAEDMEPQQQQPQPPLQHQQQPPPEPQQPQVPQRPPHPLQQVVKSDRYEGEKNISFFAACP